MPKVDPKQIKELMERVYDHARIQCKESHTIATPIFEYGPATLVSSSEIILLNHTCDNRIFRINNGHLDFYSVIILLNDVVNHISKTKNRNFGMDMWCGTISIHEHVPACARGCCGTESKFIKEFNLTDPDHDKIILDIWNFAYNFK